MRPVDRPLTLERLRQVLSYDPVTGIFRWQTHLSRRNHIGDQAGTISQDGYRVIQIDGWHYQAARLAWLYQYGRWPVPMVDHRDLNKDNNALANLREATSSQNNINVAVLPGTRSGVKGVSFARGRWKAQIRHSGKRIYLGQFATPEEAHAAYKTAARKLHGDFARFD